PTTVTIKHDNAPQTTVRGTATVTEVGTLTVTSPQNQNSSEGASISFNLGSFTDPTGTSWLVVVKWGDGTPDTTFTANSPGPLARPHGYAEEANYAVLVTLTSNTNASGSASFQVNVSDPAVVATAVNFSAVPGTAFNNQ